jgi:hypothetical protein
MPELGKGLVILGAVLLAVGLVLLFSDKIPFLGKMPGDIVLRRKNVTFYFPLATSILLSILLSFILYLISRFR